MNVQSAGDLKSQILDHIDSATQVDTGKDINVLIDKIGKTKFKELSKTYQSEKKDQKYQSRVRYLFTIVAICLSVVTVICAIASIIFASGIVAAGVQTVAVVTGFIGVSTAFGLLDKAIYRYLKLDAEQKSKSTVINRLETQFNNVRTLISSRINTLGNIKIVDVKKQRAAEILSQIRKVNAYLKTTKEQLPDKISKFPVIDASPLLKHA